MSVEQAIYDLAKKYSEELDKRVKERVLAMESDDKSHYLIYHILGISQQESDAIELYQNKGRFLYRYAGTFIENITKICFKTKFPEMQSIKIPNTLGRNPKTFEIDCLIDKNAYEIKWRDATADGDHILKEHTRIKAIAEAGYSPIRIMYFYPNRLQAIKIQSTIADLYKANNGAYYYKETAWEYIRVTTGIDLFAILQKIADDKSQ
jgi:hypothetical protein